MVQFEDENEKKCNVYVPGEISMVREREEEMERSEIAENECETDRRLCAEAADGLGSSRARRRNTAFVLPAVCLPAFFFFLSVCMSPYLSYCLSACWFAWKCFNTHQYAPALLMSFSLFSSLSYSNLTTRMSLSCSTSLSLLLPPVSPFLFFTNSIHLLFPRS